MAIGDSRHPRHEPDVAHPSLTLPTTTYTTVLYNNRDQGGDPWIHGRTHTRSTSYRIGQSNRVDAVRATQSMRRPARCILEGFVTLRTCTGHYHWLESMAGILFPRSHIALPVPYHCYWELHAWADSSQQSGDPTHPRASHVFSPPSASQALTMVDWWGRTRHRRFKNAKRGW